MRRCFYDVVADILEALSKRVEGLRVTELCRVANLPVDRGLKVLEVLERYGLIYVVPERGRKVYRIGEAGYSFLAIYEELVNLIPVRKVTHN